MGISRDRITGILCTIFRSEDAPNQEKWLNHVEPQPDAPKKKPFITHTLKNGIQPQPSAISLPPNHSNMKLDVFSPRIYTIR